MDSFVKGRAEVINKKALFLWINVRRAIMTIAEEILEAVSVLVMEKGMQTFRRLDIRKQMGVDKHKWEYGVNDVAGRVR